MFIPLLMDALAVTPSDANDLVRPGRDASNNPTVAQDNTNKNFIGTGALIPGLKTDMNVAIAITVGVGGNVTYIDYMGNTQLIVLQAVGQYYLRAKRIKATGTTATGITAYFPVFQ